MQHELLILIKLIYLLFAPNKEIREKCLNIKMATREKLVFVFNKDFWTEAVARNSFVKEMFLKILQNSPEIYV